MTGIERSSLAGRGGLSLSHREAAIHVAKAIAIFAGFLAAAIFIGLLASLAAGSPVSGLSVV
jgi:hypothetical protein